MAAAYFTTVTDSGTRKMFEALNGEKKVNIVDFAVGDGGGRGYTPTPEMTELKNEVWRGKVRDCHTNAETENVLVVESVLPSDVGGFTIREMGVFDDSGTLIAICNTPDTQKARISDGVVHELDLSMELLLSNTDVVEVMVGSMLMATKKDIENLKKEVAAKSVGQAATIRADSWTGEGVPYCCTLEVEGATDTNNIEVLPPPELSREQFDAMADALIVGGGQGDGYIQLVAWGERPEADLPVIIIVRGD